MKGLAKQSTDGAMQDAKAAYDCITAKEPDLDRAIMFLQNCKHECDSAIELIRRMQDELAEEESTDKEQLLATCLVRAASA